MKKYYCINCSKKISDYRVIRCRKCADKQHSIRMKGIKKSLSWRNKISKTMIRKGTCKDKNNPMFGKVTHGKWGKYNGIYMRSSWELNFAKWLTLSGYKWKYEPKTFDLGNTTYTPDFIFQNGIVILR